MSKVRKALVAGLTAAAGAVLSALTGGGGGLPKTSADWLAVLGTAVGVGLAAAYVVWLTPNAPTVTPPADGSVRR